MQKKVNIVTLGCSKNLVDSEILATHLSKSNYKIFFDSDINSAKIAIINTCGFINDAKQESIDTIMDFVIAKKNKLIDKIYVVGCLSGRYNEQLKSEIKEVDGFFGTNDLEKILNSINSNFIGNLFGERIISTPSHYAYLKISEGCNRKCSFCAIPLIRGKHVSEPIEKIVQQAKYLTENGVKELLMISQDTSFYGKDLYDNFFLNKLTEELLKIDKLEWLRLHYLYPTKNLEPVIDLMASNSKICNYIDIPFQHISNKILKSMKRGHNEKFIRELVEMFRKKVPDVALRTTLIVGYPGENDKDFELLRDFVNETKFERLGAFVYSEEEGTSAALLKDDVPKKLKQKRLEEIMTIQSNISLEKNTKKIGKTFKVIVDREEDEFFVGRTQYDSPEVDNEVLITKNPKIKIGNFYNVKITNAEEFDLFAELEI